MGEKEITVVCVYNNEQQLHDELMKSLSRQKAEYCFIGINNCHNRFSSCSSAFNSILDSITTEYVVFSHQDIIIEDPDFLDGFVNYLKMAGEDSVVGVAGVDLKSKKIITNILHGNTHYRVTPDPIHGLLRSETVDECFFGGKSETFKRLKFDEKLCDGWDLYAVEICLRIRRKKGRVYTCDMPLIHSSCGKISYSYCNVFKRICDKYRRKISHLYTTCLNCNTGFWKCRLFVGKNKLLVFLVRTKKTMLNFLKKGKK